MITRFVEVPREAFQAFFDRCNASLAERGREGRWRAVEAHGELTYDYPMAVEKQGIVKVVVYTTVPWRAGVARPCGHDSIRVAMVFCDPSRRMGISSTAKVLRTGSPEKVLARVQERIAQLWVETKLLKRCARCGAPAYGDSGRCVVAECRNAGGRAA